MRVSEAKKLFKDLTQEYFAGAWVSEEAVQGLNPGILRWRMGHVLQAEPGGKARHPAGFHHPRQCQPPAEPYLRKRWRRGSGVLPVSHPDDGRPVHSRETGH